MADATLLCAQCDYDLRMLDPAGVRPECALPIEKSVEAAKALPERARRTWRRAALVLFWAQAARVVLLVAVQIWQWHYQEGWGFAEASLAVLNPWPLDELLPYVPDLASSDESLVSRIFLGLWLMIFLAHVCGCWLIGTKVVEKPALGWLRLTARWSGLVAIAVWTVVWMVRDDASISSPVALTMLLLPMVPTLAVLIWSGVLLSMLRAPDHMKWVIAVALSLSFTLGAVSLPGALSREHAAPAGAAITWVVAVTSTWMWIVLARRARSPDRMT